MTAIESRHLLGRRRKSQQGFDFLLARIRLCVTIRLIGHDQGAMSTHQSQLGTEDRHRGGCDDMGIRASACSGRLSCEKEALSA